MEFGRDSQEILNGCHETAKGHIPVIEDMVRCVKQGTRPEVDGERGESLCKLSWLFMNLPERKEWLKFHKFYKKSR